MNAYKYKKAITDILKCNPNHIFLYWKGRVALYSILKAIEIKEGDEVILPAFTCVVVPNAILYLGAKPVYIDICPVTYNIDISKLKLAITSKTKVIICQNTFGLSSDIEQIVQIAKDNNLYTIEDCTHGFGGYYNGKPNGSFCDAAFYSTQWNKPFSTGIGGFLVVNNEKLLEKVSLLESEKFKPTVIDKLSLLFLVIIRKYFVKDFIYWFVVKFYRFLSNKNLVLGSNRSEELNGINMPQHYFKDISAVQIKCGIKELKKIKRVNSLRKKNATEYTMFLKNHMKIFVNESLFDNHLFLKYPILVKDRDLFLKIAENEKIIISDWFLSPIHPIKNNYELWGLETDYFPIAFEISKRIVNLPTDTFDINAILNFLTLHLDLIV